MKALILAGGFGTRLQSELNGLPKPLAPVGAHPLLFFQIQNWINQGLSSFVFLLHYQADLIIDFINQEKNNLLYGCRVEYLIEPQPMGTGGAIAYAVEELNIEGNFLVINADTWLSKGVFELTESEAPSILAVKAKDLSRYGNIAFNDQKYIINFSEKSIYLASGWINAGMYHLKPNFFKDWDRQPFSLEQVTLPKLAIGRELKAVPVDADFVDVGIPVDYQRFCRWMAGNNVGEL